MRPFDSAIQTFLLSGAKHPQSPRHRKHRATQKHTPGKERRKRWEKDQNLSRLTIMTPWIDVKLPQYDGMICQIEVKFKKYCISPNSLYTTRKTPDRVGNDYEQRHNTSFILQRRKSTSSKTVRVRKDINPTIRGNGTSAADDKLDK